MKPGKIFGRQLGRLRAWRDGYVIEPSARVDRKAIIKPKARGDIRIGAGTKIHSYAMLASHGGHISFGSNCSVNNFAVIYGHGGLTIGNDVRIAAHAVIIPANHNWSDASVPIRKQGLTKLGVTIGNDVWIGAHAVVLDGVTIGDGCVIAAGAVLSRSTEPYGVYAGVPARRIKERQ